MTWNPYHGTEMGHQNGKRIRRALEDLGISLAEIGRRCGKTRQHVSQVVAGKRPSAKVWDEVDKALKQHPEAASLLRNESPNPGTVPNAAPRIRKSAV